MTIGIRRITGAATKMKYITAIFYTEKKCERPGDKVIYFRNPGSDARSASLFSMSIESDYKLLNKKAHDIHARTFELEVPSYDLR